MLNGKRYDALTGKMLDAPESAKSKAVKPAVHKDTFQTGKVVDGFTRKRPSAHVSHSVHKKPEHSKTLMRQSVKKPVLASAKPASVKPIQPTHKIIGATTPFRELRAEHVKKSRLISKFGSEIARGTSVITAVLPVKPAPGDSPAPRAMAASAAHHVPSVAHPFANAVQNAKSHEQPKIKKVTRRHKAARKLGISTKTLNMTAGLASLVIIAGYIAYQNLPNLSLRVAAARAGVHASLPGYHPAGFALSGPIKYQTGSVVLSYKSNSQDSRNFQVTQSTSDWNSDSLVQNFVATNHRGYQSYQDNGKTIYIYEGNNATWVDGGVWYQIEGNASLNSDQLLRIAKSL